MALRNWLHSVWGGTVEDEGAMTRILGLRSHIIQAKPRKNNTRVAGSGINETFLVYKNILENIFKELAGI